jgi:hypothetical protein
VAPSRHYCWICIGETGMLNEIVQQEPAASLDPEQMGSVAAIGILKGKPFAPDARMKKILMKPL